MSSIFGPRPPIPIPHIPFGKVLKRLVSAGKAFVNTLFNGDDVKSKEAFNEKKSTADDVMQLNAALVEYRNKIQTDSREMEENIRKICDEVFKEILDSLEFANEQYQFYRLESAQRKLNRCLENIDGIFAKHVAKRISLDDTECVAILKMPPSDVKGTRMAELKKKVFEETIQELCRIIEEFQDEFFDGMDMSVNARMTGIEDSIREKTEKFSVFSDDSEESTQKTEKLQLEACYICSLVRLYETV